MQVKRSEHISIGVNSEELEKAVLFYKELFSAKEIERTEKMVGLKGENFTLWLTTDTPGHVFQEWVPKDSEDTKARFLAAGCRLIEAGDCGHGFFVADPYGLRYHVYTEQDEFQTKMFS